MSEAALLYWVKERESIRKKKAAGLPAPWTDDPILQTYRFCNVRRSDDRVSQWLINRVLKEEYIQADLDGFLLFSAFCRWVNWPPTIEGILNAELYPSAKLNWTDIGSFVDEYHGLGEKAWTGAYMVRAKPGDSNRGKGRFVAEDVIEQSMTPVLPQLKEAFKQGQRQQVWAVLEGCMNWGSFMAGQVVADWGYTSLLRDAVDTAIWAPRGPGSQRGFNRVMGRPLQKKISAGEWCRQLYVWRAMIIYDLGIEYIGLTLHDVQNCLCELDKYLRVKAGQGRPRAKYKPETAF